MDVMLCWLSLTKCFSLTACFQKGLICDNNDTLLIFLCISEAMGAHQGRIIPAPLKGGLIVHLNSPILRIVLYVWIIRNPTLSFENSFYVLSPIGAMF